MSSAFAMVVLGFVLGMRHATDADHVVAVSTIVSQQRSVRSAGLVGAVWGVGHTFTVLAIGGAIVLFDLVIPPRLGLASEFVVAIMLVSLGALNLTGAMRRIERAAHDAAAPHAHGLRPAQLARSLVVGLVHGLAGSAAVALLVLSTIREPRWAFAYLLLFGFGTVVGMMMITAALALPFRLAGGWGARVNRRLVQATSWLSIGLGLFLAYKIGFADGLFLAAVRWTPE